MRQTVNLNYNLGNENLVFHKHLLADAQHPNLFLNVFPRKYRQRQNHESGNTCTWLTKWNEKKKKLQKRPKKCFTKSIKETHFSKRSFKRRFQNCVHHVGKTTFSCVLQTVLFCRAKQINYFFIVKASAKLAHEKELVDNLIK